MNTQSSNHKFERIPTSSHYQRVLEYENYVRQRKLAVNQKMIFKYDDVKLALTRKQSIVLKLVALGLSNTRIAQELGLKDATVKLVIYRLMKYLQTVLFEPVDRFYLIIVAQKLESDNTSYNNEQTLKH